jgi:hypothetical protein
MYVSKSENGLRFVSIGKQFGNNKESDKCMLWYIDLYDVILTSPK